MARIWVDIYAREKARLATGRWKRGDRFQTIEGLARQYKVSSATSRRVLAELTRDGLVVGVPRAGTIICAPLQPHQAFLVNEEPRARSPASDDRFLITEVLRGVFEQAPKDRIKLTSVLRDFLFGEQGKGGCFLVCYDAWDLPPNFVSRLPSDRTVVLAHTPHGHPNCHVTALDLEKGGWLATEHLIGKGHRRIALVGASLDDPWQIRKFQGYFKAVTDHALPFNTHLVRELELAGQRGREVGRHLRALLSLKDPPTALLCSNDLIAGQVLDYCQTKGVRVPEDLAICGFDNRHEASLTTPALTTIETHLDRCGSEAVRIMTRLMEGEQDVPLETWVAPELVVREST